MQPHASKEPSKRKVSRSIQKKEPAVTEQEPVHCQPVSPCDDLQARIAQRAYELHVERGYREGRALDDWLEAEREIFGLECNA
jgi:Protein of unknown function (DUF2934)